jgi:hypothetical protein
MKPEIQLRRQKKEQLSKSFDSSSSKDALKTQYREIKPRIFIHALPCTITGYKHAKWTG